MKITVLQLDNSIQGIGERFKYIESLISAISKPEFVVLPELSTSSYIPNEHVWQYKELNGEITRSWATEMAVKYKTYIGAGYVESDGVDIYNSYLIAREGGVLGSVRKSEPESNIFKTGRYGHIIDTPLGKIAVAICFDSHKKAFYDDIKDKEPVLILMPHAWATNKKDQKEDREKIDFLGQSYAGVFGCPVVFANAQGTVEKMPGITGAMMDPRVFTLNGGSAIYQKGRPVGYVHAATSMTFDIVLESSRQGEIPFYGDWIDEGNSLWRNVILPFDTSRGKRIYERKKHLA